MSVALSRYFNSLTTWENLEEVGVVSSVVEKKYKLRAHCHLGHIELKQCVPLHLDIEAGQFDLNELLLCATPGVPYGP